MRVGFNKCQVGFTRHVNTAVGSKLKINSRLNERHQSQVEGRAPALSYEAAKGRKALCERFGHYGIDSGIDMRRLWPAVEEIEYVNELNFNRKLADAIKIAEEAKQMLVEKKMEREKTIEENLDGYEEKLDKFLQSKVNAEPVSEIESSSETAKKKRTS